MASPQTSINVPIQVLGTDGVWDVMTNAEVVAFVEDYRSAPHAAMSAADALSWEAQQRWKAVGEQVLLAPAPTARMAHLHFT
jgi:serine/threonine protein phosphatase PrpC